MTHPPTHPPTWLLPAEVAALARMSRQTVYRHMRDGRLPATQFAAGGAWRAHTDDVQAWLRGSVPPAGVVSLRRTA